VHRAWSALAMISGALAAVVVAGCAGPAAVHQVSCTNAAIQQVPHTKAAVIQPVPRAMAAWQAAIRRVQRPGRGCFSAHYPALAWRAVECETAPKWPFPPGGEHGPGPPPLGTLRECHRCSLCASETLRPFLPILSHSDIPS